MRFVRWSSDDAVSAADAVVERLRAVEVLFSIQVGGGTDIDSAVATGVARDRPADTVVVLMSDLIEAGDQSSLMRARGAGESGATVVVLLALSDDDAPMQTASSRQRARH